MFTTAAHLRFRFCSRTLFTCYYFQKFKTVSLWKPAIFHGIMVFSVDRTFPHFLRSTSTLPYILLFTNSFYALREPYKRSSLAEAYSRIATDCRTTRTAQGETRDRTLHARHLPDDRLNLWRQYNLYNGTFVLRHITSLYVSLSPFYYVHYCTLAQRSSV